MKKIVLSAKSKPEKLILRLLSLAFILLIYVMPLRAQVNVVYNQFFMNPYLYNPAYAGVEGHTVVFALYRQQWMNFESSPAISNVSFHTPLKGGIGIGATVFNETQGPLTTTWGKVSGSYLITVDKTHYLRFGMSVGAGNNSLNFTDLDAPDDPAFTSLVDNSNFFIGDFGATYHFGHFNAGFSIPNLVTYDVITPESSSPIRVSPLDNVMLKLNYRGHLNDDIAIEPHLIYRYSEIGPDQYEGTVILHIKHVTWAGASFRQDNNLVALLGIKLKESIALGYSFELGNSSIASSLGPTHEVHIGWHMGSKKEHAEHVSSFIKSHRLTAEQRARKAALEEERNLAQLRQQRAQRQQQRSSQEDEDSLGGLLQGSTESPESEAPSTQEIPEEPNNSGTPTGQTRANIFGEEEQQVNFERVNENGEVETVSAWIPTDNPDETWTIDPDAEHRERINNEGTKEVAVELLKTGSDGNVEKVVQWQPVGGAVPILTPLTDTDIPPVEESTQEPVIEDNAPESNTLQETQEPETPDEVNELPTEEEDSLIIESPVEEPSITPTEPEPDDSPQEENVVRGNHFLELPAGNYVIAGAFEDFDGAETISDSLFQRGFHEAKVGYVSERGYYYVVIFQSDQLGNAQNERNRVRRLPGLDQVWVLTVSE